MTDRYTGHGDDALVAAPDCPPPITALEERQHLLAHHIRLVARKLTNGLFVYGSGGCGKSKVITEVLQPIDVVSRWGPDDDVDDVDRHVRAVMQTALDALAAKRRLPVIG